MPMFGRDTAASAPADVVFDKRDQLDQVLPFILPGERLYAVFDCRGRGTGFIALTDRRLVFYDKAFLGNRKALTSIPYRQISALSSVDEGGILRSSSHLVVTASGQAYEFEFGGGEKAQRAYAIILGEILQSEPA